VYNDTFILQEYSDEKTPHIIILVLSLECMYQVSKTRSFPKEIFSAKLFVD
jgi:hypothetical protein